jgi:hypothetical protein
MSPRRVFLLAVFGLLFSVLIDVTALAQGSSGGYRIDESFIGPGSNLESQSGGYIIEDGQQSTGSVGSSESDSGSYRVLGGHTTTQDPSLVCALNASQINFGAFSTAVTSTATASFSVKNYTSYGYSVRLIGGTPKMGEYSLSSLSSTAPSELGTEQFGINLVANTSPEVFGAFPQQVPSSDFSSGDSTPNYSTPNNFRYVEGETIASAGESSGQTDYTISYIINISTNTPGGDYSADQVILCTGTY